MDISTFNWILQVTISILLALSKGTAGDFGVCGGTLTEDNDEISSPRYPRPYPPNVECTWLIKAPETYIIQLTFSAFSLELSYDCSCDYVVVEEIEWRTGGRTDAGVVENGHSITNQSFHCGSQTPPVITSKNNTLVLRFHSDGSVAGDGFRAIYQFLPDPRFHSVNSVCGGIRTDSDFDILSPMYPELYPNNVDCTWLIMAPEEHSIRLTFANINLEDAFNDVCNFDYVMVEEKEGDVIGKFCGSVKPPVITSVNNTLTVKFHADHSNARNGFKAKYEFLPKPNENSKFSSEVKGTTESEYETFAYTSHGTAETTEISPHETATPNESDASHKSDKTLTPSVIEVPQESQTGAIPETQTLHGPGASQETGIQYETVTPDLSPPSATDLTYLMNEFFSKMEKYANEKDKSVEILLGILLGLSTLIIVVGFYIYKRRSRRSRNDLFLKHSAFPQPPEVPSSYDSRSTKESVTFLL